MSASAAATAVHRGLGVAQFGFGVLVLLRAPALLRWIQQEEPPVHAVTAARALGVRDLVQGAVTAVRPGPVTAHAGAGVDALHLASMVALAVRAPRYRRIASVAAAQAAADLLVGFVLVRAVRRLQS